MPEKEYIERDSVYNVINEAMTAGMVDVYTATQRRSDFEEALEAIELVPTAYVQPVKHGHWVWESNYRDYDGDICSVYSCSVCSVHSDDTTNFCPNCGAKMVRKV